MAEGGESLQEAVEESQRPFDPPLDQVNLPGLKVAFYLNGDHIREARNEKGEVVILGEGAFGRVTKVYCNKVPCAAKELRDDRKLLNDENRRRATKGFFVESLELARRLRHPNIVQYIGLWNKPNVGDVIIMELLPRSSLTQYLRNSAARIRSIPLRVKRKILVDVCCAMIYLHNLRPYVLHRDLTSNNILLANDFTAKVTDFGQARFYVDADQQKLTKQPGTKMYMPPEALRPEPKYGKPLDRFSFGCVALQMLTHKWPEPNAGANKKPRTPWEDRKYLLPNPSREQRDEFIQPIIIPCLDIKPEKRPTFETIYCTLTSGDVFTDAECIRMLDQAIDPASKQNKLSTGVTSSPTIQKEKHQPKTAPARMSPVKGSDANSPSPPAPTSASSVPHERPAHERPAHNNGSENSSMFDVLDESFPGASMAPTSVTNPTTTLRNLTNVKDLIKPVWQFTFQGICGVLKPVWWWLMPLLICLCIFLLRVFCYL